MSRIPPRWRVTLRAVAALGIALSIAAAAAGLSIDGSLFGTLTDPTGKPLAGVRVSLGLGKATAVVQASDTQGRVRFLGLDPGSYHMRAELTGFVPVQMPAVAVQAGTSTALQVKMSPVPAETITVVAEPPRVGAERFTPVLVVQQSELETVPTARDPWSIAAQTPGVLISGVNSGGSASGQQLVVLGPGAGPAETAFVVEGVAVTDLTATGSSAQYYDFGQLEAMSVAAGTADPSAGNAGATLNMLTRRASNDWRATGRELATDGRLQSPARVDQRDLAAGQTATTPTHVERIDEYGAEGGGPVVRDRGWLWGAASSNRVRRVSYGDTPVAIDLDHASAKLDFQATPRISGVLFGLRSEKDWYGRGASPNRAPETVVDQHSPTALGKLAAEAVLSSRWTLGARISRIDETLHLAPRGGLDVDPLLDADSVYRGTWADIRGLRASDEGQLEVQAALGAERRHELSLGFDDREYRDLIRIQWGARDVLFIASSVAGSNGEDLGQLRRPAAVAALLQLRALWLRDVWKVDDATFSLGLRLDEQNGSNRASQAPANPAFQDLLPPLAYRGGGGFDWRTVSPRLGVSYALGRERATTLSAAYSRFASQLGAGLIERSNPLAGYAYVAFQDANGDHVWQPGEPYRTAGYWGIDPQAPDRTPNRNDPGLRPETTAALDLSLQRRIGSQWTVRLDLTRREVSGILEERDLVRTADGSVRQVLRSDYVFERALSGALPGGGSYSVPIYRLAPGLEFTGGKYLTNGDRRQVYRGATLSATRTPQDGWMWRGYIVVSDWRWRIGPDFRAHDDPTDAGPTAYSATDPADSNGDVVAPSSSGLDARDQQYVNARWTAGMSGFVRLAPRRPWGFTLAANLSARDGFPIGYAVQAFSASGEPLSVAVESGSAPHRYPALWTADLRLEKELRFGEARVVLGADVFNLFNRLTPLLRSRQVNSTRSGYLLDTLSPRVARLGVTVSWR